MNEFNIVKGADAQVIFEINDWSNKIKKYLHDFFENDIEQTRGTKFGDCISKVAYIFEIALTEPETFRGVRDVLKLKKLQAVAIVQPNSDYLELYALSNAPWNVLKNQPETIKGAATSLIEELINESFELGMEGRLKLVTIERAKPFYTKIGFTQSEDGLGELELTPIAAERFLESQRRRRNET